MANPIEEDKKTRRRLIVCGAILFTVLTACAVWFYLAMEKNAKEEKADYILSFGQKEYYLPCTAKDLPFAYTTPSGEDAGEQDDTGHWISLDVYEKGETVPFATVQCFNAEGVLRAREDYIAVGISVKESCPVSFAIAGISQGDGEEKLRSTLGEPAESTGGVWRYDVQGEPGSSLTFLLKDGKVAAFDLTRGEGYPFGKTSE